MGLAGQFPIGRTVTGYGEELSPELGHGQLERAIGKTYILPQVRPSPGRRANSIQITFPLGQYPWSDVIATDALIQLAQDIAPFLRCYAPQS